jgi:HSP20 family molecular chaperone IbpA
LHCFELAFLTAIFRVGLAMPGNSRRCDELFLHAARSFQQQAYWQPSVDAFRTSRGWVLKYELAGISPAEVRVSVSGRTVVVEGVRRDVRIEACQQSHCMEISYNQFSRTLELPGDVSRMRVATDYRDGMLLVYLTNEGAAHESS